MRKLKLDIPLVKGEQPNIVDFNGKGSTEIARAP